MPKERSATIVLDYPVQLADRELTEVVMRRPTLHEEIKYAPAAANLRVQAEEEAKYFARLCGLTREEMGKLDLGDYDRVQKQYLFFRGRAEAPARTEDDDGGAESDGQNAAD